MSDIENVLKDILVVDLFIQLEPDKILPTHSLRNDLGLDSVGFVELRQQIETRLGVTISDDDFTPEHFATITTLGRLIQRRRSDAIAS